MILARIEISKNIDQIKKLFEPEIKKVNNNRTSVKIKKSDNRLMFEINAKDIVALKAILNSITKLLEVYEKTCKIKIG